MKFVGENGVKKIKEYVDEHSGGASVSWNQIAKEGEKLAEITIQGNTTEVYAPESTTDYNDLANKPKINSVELTGDKTSSQLNMYDKDEVDRLIAQGRSVKLSVSYPPANPVANTLYYCYQGQDLPYKVVMYDSTLEMMDMGTTSVDLSGYQLKEDENLTTESKSIVGAINEVKETPGGASEWSNEKTYKKEDQVWVKDEENRMYRYFFSLADDNLGNDPISTEGKKWLSAGTTSISGVIGEVINFAGTTPPANFLVCAGQAVSRTTYKDLFNVIGTTYGAGDGSTTFNLPLLNDNRFVEGSSTPGTKKDGAIPSHKHTYDKAISGDWAKSSSSPYGDATFSDYGIPYFRDMQTVNHNDGQYDDFRVYKGNDYSTSGDIDWLAVSPKDSSGGAVKPIKINTESASTLTYGSGSIVQPKSLTLLPCIRYAKDRERYGDHLFKVYSSSQAPNPADYKEGDIVLWIQG